MNVGEIIWVSAGAESMSGFVNDEEFLARVTNRDIGQSWVTVEPYDDTVKGRIFLVEDTTPLEAEK